jgi:hypothetical protein
MAPSTEVGADLEVGSFWTNPSFTCPVTPSSPTSAAAVVNGRFVRCTTRSWLKFGCCSRRSSWILYRREMRSCRASA